MLNEYTFNIGECCFWEIICLILFAKSFRDALPLRPTLRLLAVGFFFFGISDYIEAHTGAWWTPLWLLALKGSCILVFIFGFTRYQKISKSLKIESDRRP